MPDIPTSQFSDKELKFSYWYITNKLLLRKLLIASLIIVASLFWLFVLWQLLVILIDYPKESQGDRRLISDAGSLTPQLVSLKPLALQLSSAQTLAGDGENYDILAEIVNPNPDWYSVFDYRFSAESSGGQWRSGFILPGESKYLMNLGIKNSSGQLEIANQKWQRIDNPKKVFDERFDFDIKDEKFLAATGASDPSRLNFEITNRSAYGYWEVGVNCLLLSGGNIVSVNYLTLDQFESGETKKIEMLWQQGLPRIDSVKIIPEVNIFDQSNIMKPEGDLITP